MTGNLVSKKSKPTYLLVSDLPEMMEAYERVGLKIPDADFFKNQQDCMKSMLTKSIDGCSLEVVSAGKLTNNIASLLHDLLAITPEAIVISTVSDVASKTGGHCLQVNRLVSPVGNILGIGARPGHSSLAIQFSEMKGCLEKRPVILVED